MGTVFETMNRRQCVKVILMLGAGIVSGGSVGRAEGNRPKSKVVVVRTDDRIAGVKAAMAEFDLSGFNGATVAMKANYNSADPFPASTHPETLRTLAQELLDIGAASLTLVERSGMGDTPGVLREMGAVAAARDIGFTAAVMDEDDPKAFVRHTPSGSHWKRGFLLERRFNDSDKVVQTCCLKTHQFGGHFTLALKNAVGAVAKYDPETGYNYMSELHGSPLQRTLIAEISQAFRNDLIVMDGLKAFTTGGPHQGREVAPGVILAATDPVAIDAVGVALLRLHGTTPEVSRGPIFEQEQIRRAAELGIGAASPDDIDFVPIGEGAEQLVQQIKDQIA